MPLCFGGGRYSLLCEGGAAGLVLGVMAFAAAAVAADDGLTPGEGGVHGEEAFEGEDGQLEQVEGQPGDEASEGEGDEDADELIVLAGVFVAYEDAEVIEVGLEQYVEDVKAVADASEPAERSEGEEGAGQTVAQNEWNGRCGGDTDGGQAEPELGRSGEIERAIRNAGEEEDEDSGEEGRTSIFADNSVAAGLAASRADAASHGEGDGGSEGQGSGVGEEEVVVEMVDAGPVEGGERVDGVEEYFGQAEDPEAEAKSVAAAVGEEQDERPDEIELLFNGQRPEVIERQGEGGLEGSRGEMGEVLQEEDEEGERLELREGGTMQAGVDCDTEDHGEVQG